MWTINSLFSKTPRVSFRPPVIKEANRNLLYVDTPYISQRGVGVDYLSFYHFLEGLATYEDWPEQIDYGAKHRQLKAQSNPWTDKKQIYIAFERLFRRYENSLIVVSYRSIQGGYCHRRR